MNGGEKAQKQEYIFQIYEFINVNLRRCISKRRPSGVGRRAPRGSANILDLVSVSFVRLIFLSSDIGISLLEAFNIRMFLHYRSFRHRYLKNDLLAIFCYSRPTINKNPFCERKTLKTRLSFSSTTLRKKKEIL